MGSDPGQNLTVPHDQAVCLGKLVSNQRKARSRAEYKSIFAAFRVDKSCDLC